ncbi:hypothetical protein [Pontibacter harenae]|uniref:hypothetical protein n=1 Tax=Pontibacter harenae TaxID=2894083 RepID=UPI001E4B2832|nr:hypothetical protein [Pontibacter harenae]MCC9168914.1 hypothetical protein [Pontibacter harenae]
MKKTYLLLASSLMLSFTACNSNEQSQEGAGQDSTAMQDSAAAVNDAPTPAGEVMSKDGLRVYAFDDSPKFPDAALKLKEPAAGGTVEPGPVNFVYELENYQLTQMTESSHAAHMANSHQGQHIHNIVDNEPYTAHYETEFTKELEAGDHVILSFLSRSYHESLKHEDAYDLRVVTAGKPAQKADFDENAPHMFYSRPKGEYTGDETKRIMLDFYLVNTELSPEGNKVRATVNGSEFMLERWLPYAIEGLPMGENTIKLELLDQDGKVLPGPYNSVERTITLKDS